ncbi:hypothetical protein NP493_314g01010 [Ridgeia piscesae]|uniref:SH2 domain-containing protein n=1 Tax=Ridgeia piscesae TaxID=27915 RepID=A0AAD9L5R1_RIDPI|nr:hypothetical protein NP493_314g01010 [Ridgeia piscesae]
MSVYSKNEAAGWNNGASGYSKAAEAGFYDNPGAAGGHFNNDRPMYDNKQNSNPAYDNYKTPQLLGFEAIVYDNKENLQQANGQVPKRGSEYMNYPDKPPEYDNPKASVPQVAPLPTSLPQPSNGQLDPFDMQPFGSSLPSGGQVGDTLSSPYNEPWFQGRIPRQQCTQMLRNDGDFLVRESSNSTGQFVLSSRQDGHIKHLLLVDPEGVVRTKDREFGSVSDLINYHRDNNIPIISNDCEILLQTPILNS